MEEIMQPDPLSPQEMKAPKLNFISEILTVLVLLFLLIAVAGLGFWAYRLNTNLTATQQQLSILQGEHNKLKADYEKIKGNNEKLNVNLTAAQTELESIKQDLVATQFNLKTAQEQNKILQAKIDAISVTTVNITNAHMARDASDKERTNVFSPNDPAFYCFFSLTNAPDSTVLRGAWTLVQAEGYESNSFIDEGEITSGDAELYFSLDRGESLWPVGQYKLDIYIDDNLAQTLDFEVQ
jgi:hypothetical protein